jgi:alkanesulfonate monooxygenase SsuD/methylene tetrahydromethanopterin reductase-like flavin-dependent oxidoreductase (luciferase family)
MPLRSIALAVPDFAALTAVASHVEDAGFDRAWTTELRSRDAVVRAVQVAAHTKRLLTGTGIAYAFTRHPMAMAASAVEAAAATGGRLTVGLGAGTPHTRGEFGIEFDHPAPRLAEYVTVMRSAVDTAARGAGDLEHHGRFYDVSMPAFAFGHERALLESVSFYGAALLPLALKLLAAVCDGLALHPFAHVDGYLNEVVLPTVGQAAAQAGRPRPALAAWLVSCALDDRDEARALARAQLALYAAQPVYASFFEHTPWAADAARIRDAANLVAGRVPWRALGTDLISDRMLDDLAAAGTPREVAERVAAAEARLASLGVAELTVQVPGVALPAEHTERVLRDLVAALAR